MKVTLLGLGSGLPETYTMQAQTALAQAELLIGPRRLLDALPDAYTAERRCDAASEEILSILKQSSCAQAVVLLSGDSGFYSGARLLLPLLERHGFETEVFAGISCVQLFAARLKRAWQDWALISAHGVVCDAVTAVMQGRPAFFLTGGAQGPDALCAQLAMAGLTDLPVAIGENLGCPNEAIICGTAGEMAGRSFAPLSVMLAQAAPVMPRRTPGWPDELFIRGQVPMTKQMVRAAALAKLAIGPRDTCWDIGAGTGSVSIELAAMARRVYAVESEAQACALILENRKKHCAWNLTLAQGRAPEMLIDLPAPDAVFIGGSRGELTAIVDAVLQKNAAARLCIAAIALETLSAATAILSARGIEPDVTQLCVSSGRPAGGLHLLTANNPVFLIAGNCP